MELAYAIKYVGDMEKAVAFHRDVLGLKLKCQSPVWSEFFTGSTTLALHGASETHPAGSVQLGFSSDDLPALYAGRDTTGIIFTDPPRNVHGRNVARFLDSDGAETSISG